MRALAYRGRSFQACCWMLPACSRTRSGGDHGQPYRSPGSCLPSDCEPAELSWGHYGGPACEYASSLPSARPSSPFPSSPYPRSPPGTHPLHPSAGTQPHHPARTSLDTSPVSISKMSHSSFESTYDGRYDGMGAWGSVRWDRIGRGGWGTGPGAVMDVGRRRVGRSCCQRQ